MYKLTPMLAVLGLLCALTATAQNAPQPRLRGTAPDASADEIYLVPGGTRAPDGIGVTVKRSVTAGEYNTDVLTYVPWEDASVIQPLKVGDSIPDNSVVHTADGKPFSLNEAVKSQPTILIFYRGGWCPYCNAHLRDLQGSEPALRKMGYQILAISSDTPEEVRDFMAKNNFSYTLLSDVTLDVAAAFGLRYKISKQYLAHTAKEDFVAKNGGYLLTPGAFVFDQQGIIRFAYANNNYSVRVGQDKLLEAARDALQK